MARQLKDTKFFDAVHWNPHLKVVLHHRANQVIQPGTKEDRSRRGQCPWTAQVFNREKTQPSIP